MKRRRWSLESGDAWSAEGYWASYSDLMAGVLLVFAVAAAWVRIDFQRRIVEPTKPLEEWQDLISKMCDDEVLNTATTRVDCKTGRLIISEESLRYETNGTELSEAGRRLLVRIVPTYLSRAREYPEFASHFHTLEIAGHTDSSGRIEANTNIGASRAVNVLNFLLNAPELAPHHDLLRSHAFTAGYADTQEPEGMPQPENRDDWSAARRIEIQLHLNELGILSELKALLDSINRGREDAGSR